MIGLLFTWAFALLGCSSAEGTAKKSDGDICMAATECAGGVCEQGQCLTECKSNEDCRGAHRDEQSAFLDTCAVTQTGKRCLASCVYLATDFTCIDDVPTACSVAGEGHCEACGCPSTLRCVAGQCSEKAAVGEPCNRRSDCKSDNCSGFAGVCRQPVGASCTTANCDLCITGTSSGSSYCSRECASSADCGAGECVSFGNEYYCQLPCPGLGEPPCPGGCRYTSGGSGREVLYCDCRYPECRVMADLHPLGASCTDDSICESGNCDMAATSSDPLHGGTSYRGICSKPCAASNDCGAGFSCAAVETPHCLPHCESNCSGGTCLDLPTVEGETSKLCWAKHGEGSFCVGASDCQTGNCIKGACASAGGQANGNACAANRDCLSNACQAGICRGQGLQGDPCQVAADCSVGICCTTGALANTCALSCS